MTEQERQEMKTRLIELGFWGTTEIGNPITSNKDARTLFGRLEEALASHINLSRTGFTTDSPAGKIQIVHDSFIYTFATELIFCDAVCRTAIAMPAFLEEHPECAAIKKNEK